MSRINRSLVMWAALAWPVLAFAQSSFENSLTVYGWKTWAIVLGWCTFGLALRWASEHGKYRATIKQEIALGKEPSVSPPSFSDMLSMSIISFGAGVATFAVIEGFCSWKGYTPPGGIIGAAVAIAAFNNSRTITALSNFFFDTLDKARPKGAGDAK